MTDKPINIEIVDYDAQSIGSTCAACRGTGFAAETLALCDSFHGQDGWCHHLVQDEVNALAEAGRLFEFTHDYVKGSDARWEWKEPRVIPTAEAVNRRSWQGFGHDLINQRIAVTCRAMRLGVYQLCPSCGGEGENFH
jgi:hypothetical protein